MKDRSQIPYVTDANNLCRYSTLKQVEHKPPSSGVTAHSGLLLKNIV
jgi:hypothetical protein